MINVQCLSQLILPFKYDSEFERGVFRSSLSRHRPEACRAASNPVLFGRSHPYIKIMRNKLPEHVPPSTMGFPNPSPPPWNEGKSESHGELTLVSIKQYRTSTEKFTGHLASIRLDRFLPSELP